MELHMMADGDPTLLEIPYTLFTSILAAYLASFKMCNFHASLVVQNDHWPILVHA